MSKHNGVEVRCMYNEKEVEKVSQEVNVFIAQMYRQMVEVGAIDTKRFWNDEKQNQRRYDV